MSARAALALALGVFCAACTAGDAHERQDVADTVPDGFATTLDRASFDALAGDGTTVKFTLSTPGADAYPLPAACLFQDMARFPWHLDFLQTLPAYANLTFADYELRAIRRDARAWSVGSVTWWPSAVHPVAGEGGVFSVDIYSDLGWSATAFGTLSAVWDALGACAPDLRSRFAFLPNSDAQRRIADSHADALLTAGIPVMDGDDLRDPDALPVVLQPGVTYGTLRVFEPGEAVDDVGPRDVVIAEFPPSELTVVAGLITRAPQNPFSHLNLRMGELGAPNASMPGVYEARYITGLDGRTVRMEARGDAVDVTLAGQEDADAFWAERAPTLAPPEIDRGPRDLRRFVELDASDAPAFGAKSANLGEIASALPSAHTTDGFGIPVVHYFEFIEANGIDASIEALLRAPDVRNREARAQALRRIRDEIRDAPLLPAFDDALRARLREVFGPEVDETRIRFRSSSNIEDGDGWSGAGLHGSYSGCLADAGGPHPDGGSWCRSTEERAAITEQLLARRRQLDADPDSAWLEELVEELEEDLTETRLIEDAVRKVWASLWTERAFDAREHWGVDHTRAAMAITVNPSFVLEQLNAVAVTGWQRDEHGVQHRVVSQVGTDNVVAPLDPTQGPEVMRLSVDADDTTVATIDAYSTYDAAQRGLWSDGLRDRLGAVLQLLDAHFAADAPDGCMDIELKLDASGEIIVKQARPFAGCEPRTGLSDAAN